MEVKSVEGVSQAAASDPKQEAKNLLLEGASVEAIEATTGLSRPQILGLKGVLAKAQKKLDTAAKGSENLGKADDEEKSLITDLKSETALAANAVLLARTKGRLKAQDPTLFNSFFPSGQQPESNTSRILVDLETARLIRSMRQEEEHRNNGGGAEATETLNLRKEVDALRQEMHKKDLEALKEQAGKLEGQIAELRQDMKLSGGSNSDLAVIVKESKELLSQVITHDGALRRYLIPDGIAIKDRKEAPSLDSTQRTESSVLSELRKRGLVTKIVQRNS